MSFTGAEEADQRQMADSVKHRRHDDWHEFLKSMIDSTIQCKSGFFLARRETMCDICYVNRRFPGLRFGPTSTRVDQDAGMAALRPDDQRDACIHATNP